MSESKPKPPGKSVGYVPDYGVEAENFFRAARTQLLPKMRQSAIFMAIGAAEPDPKLAMELGMALLLDLPMLLVVPKGVAIPRTSHLWRCADEVVEGVEFDRPGATQRQINEAIERLLAERGRVS